MNNKCKKCGVENEIEVKLLLSGPHYSKIICRRCHSYISFGVNPKNIEFKNSIYEFFTTTKTQNIFILSLMKQYESIRKLSPKQIECLKDTKEYKKFIQEYRSRYLDVLNKMDEVIKKTKTDNFITDLDEKFNRLQKLMQ